jgi:hypothetical protein
MTAARFEAEPRMQDVTWEERKAQLAAMPIVPDDQIDFSDLPEVTDFSGFMTMVEAKAYRAARKA